MYTVPRHRIIVAAAVLMLLSAIGISVRTVYAVDKLSPANQINQYQANTGLSIGPGARAEDSVLYIVGRALQFALGFTGVIFFVYIIWAGFSWMTAGGDSGKVEDARGRVINATIGLGIIIFSYAITTYLMNAFFQFTFDAQSNTNF